MADLDFRSFYSEELSNFGVALYQDDKNFVAASVFPVIEVTRQSAVYNIWDSNAFLQDSLTLRAPATESSGSGFSLSQDTYSAKVWATHKDLDNQTRANWTARAMTPERAIARWLIAQAKQDRERQWATKFFKTGVWGTDVTGVAAAPTAGQFLQWNDNNSDPVSNVKTGKEAVLTATGMEPNTLIVGYTVDRILGEHPDIIARVSGAGSTASPAVVNNEVMARIFGVERYMVAKAVKATNAEGAAAATAFIYGKSALLCYVDPNVSPEMPTAGVTFAWTGGDMMGLSLAVAGIPHPLRKAVRYEIELAWDDKVTAASLGYFFASATA